MITRAALAALALAGCADIVGLRDLAPSREAFTLSVTPIEPGVVGQPLGRIRVDVVDVVGDPVRDYHGEITLAIGNNAGFAHLLGRQKATAINGSAGFTVGLDRPGAGYTLVAATPGVPPVTTPAFDVLLPDLVRVDVGVAGGTTTDVAVSPGAAGGAATVYVSGPDGVYHSSDGAAHWQPPGFAAGAPDTTLVADPVHPGVVYGRRRDSLLLKTEDDGKTWIDIATWTSSPPHVLAFAIDPSGSTLYASESRTIYRSEDAGATWVAVSELSCDMLAVDATAVYCAANSATGDLWRSPDRGETWVDLRPAFPDVPQRLLPATPRGLFIVANDGTYRSASAGATWTRVGPPVSALAYAPSQPDRIYTVDAQAQLAVSNDGGKTFGAPIDLSARALAVDLANPDRVYAATDAGVQVSSNAGATWMLASTGINAPYVASVATYMANPAVAVIDGDFAGSNRAALRTTDGGASWRPIASLPENVTITADRSGADRIFACGSRYFAISTDGGASFVPRAAAGMDTGCGAVAGVGDTLVATSAGQLLRSTDGGESWTPLTVGGGGSVFDVALGDATGEVIVAATGSGIFRSSNAGAVFQQVAGVSTTSLLATPDRIIASTCMGYRVSTDHGASFGSLLGDVCAGSLTRTGAAIYMAATKDMLPVVLRSADDGKTWASHTMTGATAPQYGSLAATTDGTLYVATFAGLYKGRLP